LSADEVDDAYEKLLLQEPSSGSQEEPAPQVDCPNCGSLNVDRSAGYRGDYKCLDCGHRWQVGGRNAT
jgi:DNA-directed RNA polymerase subunit RPC12/RpoP